MSGGWAELRSWTEKGADIQHCLPPSVASLQEENGSASMNLSLPDICHWLIRASVRVAA